MKQTRAYLIKRQTKVRVIADQGTLRHAGRNGLSGVLNNAEAPGVGDGTKPVRTIPIAACQYHADDARPAAVGTVLVVVPGLASSVAVRPGSASTPTRSVASWASRARPRSQMTLGKALHRRQIVGPVRLVE